jgi:hypothetical protein
MGDQSGSSFRVRTSDENIVRRKDSCSFVRVVYDLQKLLDISGPGLVEVGHYRIVSEPTLTVSWAHVSQLHRHDVYGWCAPRQEVKTASSCEKQ